MLGQHIITLLTVSLCLSMKGQESTDLLPPLESPWNILSKLTFEQTYYEEMGFNIDTPVISEALKNLDGQTIDVSGYMDVTLLKKNNEGFILTLLPMIESGLSCDYPDPGCSMHVIMKNGIKITHTEDQIKLKGILKIQSEDINKHLYTLVDAELLEK